MPHDAGVVSYPPNRKAVLKQILIIRFGALGDLCLLAWSLSRFAQSQEATDCQVTLVTKAAFAPLMENVHGIDRVIALPSGGFNQLRQLAVHLRNQKFDTIVDAHNILRSHLMLMLMGKRPSAQLKKHTTARLALLGLRKSHRHLNTTMSQRFDALFDSLVANPASEYPAPLARLKIFTPGSPPPLGLAPGAQWNSKRWPEENFADIVQNICQENDTPVRIFIGPREADWFPESRLALIAAKHQQVEIIQDRPLIEVASLLAECSWVLTNDSGLLHVAEAVGTPVLAFFGPTVKQFGYFPHLPGSRVLEVELECRPCSRNGKRECHRGDLACLKRIEPDLVLETLTQMTQASESSS